MENFGFNFEQGVYLAFFICIRKLINYCANLNLLFDKLVKHLKLLEVRRIDTFKCSGRMRKKWRYSLLHCLTLKHGFFMSKSNCLCFLNF